MTDTQIFEAVKNSDPNGLELLFKKYYAFLTKTAFYVTCDKEAAEDLAQDAFVKIWERRDQLPDIINFKSYLSRMVRNSALDYVKHRNSGDLQMHQFLYLEDRMVAINHDGPDDLQAEISDALLQLPPKCRLIFSMNRFEGLSNDEIADYLDISKRTVETQISKALRILRKELKAAWDQRFLGMLF